MSVKMQNSFQIIVKTLFIDVLLFIVGLFDKIPELFLSKKEKDNRLKRQSQLAKQANPNDPFSPYRTCEFPEPLKVSDPNANIFDEFERCVKKYPKLQTFGARELFSIDDEIQSNGKLFKKYELGNYKWHTYESALNRIVNISNGLLNTGINSGENIIMFSETRAEWMMCALACFRIKVPVVTLYPTLGIDALKYGINETECKYLITTSDQLPKFEKIMNDIPKITHIIVISNFNKDVEVRDFGEKNNNVQIIYFDELEASGRDIDMSYKTFQTPKRDDLAVIMYTSGSTGTPKGVMMSHGNLLASMRSFPLRLGTLRENKEIYVAYLPLAHVLELAAELGCITAGIRVAYSSPLTIVDTSTAIKKGQKGDLRVLKPTIMAAVPLILERFRKAVNEKIYKANWFTQALFSKAYEYKLNAVREGRKTFILDRILFKKISRAVLGGKIKFILCGASLLSEDVQEFIQVCLAPVRQAYALTETCAGGTGQYEFESNTLECGSVIASSELRLVDWVEGGYRNTDKPNPRGEIYLGGDNVTLGYYKLPENTKENYHVIDGVRYFATGDIGEVLPNGNLKIIDRKKDLVKLQGGEYISLSKIEVTLKLLPFVENCCVYANPLKERPICLISPNIPKIIEFAKSNDITGVDDDFKSISNNKELLKLLQKDIETHCLKQGLDRSEVPTKSKLVEEIWLPDTGLVTDSFKLKRKSIEIFYSKQIEQLYR